MQSDIQKYFISTIHISVVAFSLVCGRTLNTAQFNNETFAAHHLDTAHEHTSDKSTKDTTHTHSHRHADGTTHSHEHSFHHCGKICSGDAVFLSCLNNTIALFNSSHGLGRFSSLAIFIPSNFLGEILRPPIFA